MKKSLYDNNGINLGNVNPEKLKIFFIGHLDKIYCAKKHLVERLPDIQKQAHFSDLKHAITETLEDVEMQITRMDEIYELLNAKNSAGNYNGLWGTFEDAFSAIKEQYDEPELCDMSILFYMQNIESVEMASFQVLRMAAVKLKNEEIKQLLLENFNEAKSDRELLLLIATKYITGKLA
jgi:ferritin-like metal-binding protein YciE